MRAIVTGHSRGLGAALAERLLQEGYCVLGISRGDHQKLKACYGDFLKEKSLNLADTSAVLSYLQTKEFVDFCQSGDLLLINAAGMQAPAQILGEQSAEEIVRAVALNVTAALLLSNQVRAYCKGRLDVIHISSGAAHKAYPAWGVYGATKAALDQQARCVASEGQKGLRMVSLAPGVIDSKMQEEIRANTHFPLRARFLALAAEGALQSAEATAKAIVAFWQSKGFGENPVVDLRDLGML